MKLKILPGQIIMMNPSRDKFLCNRKVPLDIWLTSTMLCLPSVGVYFSNNNFWDTKSSGALYKSTKDLHVTVLFDDVFVLLLRIGFTS